MYTVEINDPVDLDVATEGGEDRLLEVCCSNAATKYARL